MRATVGLPGYRRLWEAAPFVFVLLGIAVVSVCAWWALGRLAGLLCAVALVAASETLRQILYVPESHGAIVLHVAVLCAALLAVYRTALAHRPRPAVLLLVGVPLVIFTGAGLTDQLLLVSGLAPFVLAPLLCWWRFRSVAWRIVSAVCPRDGHPLGAGRSAVDAYHAGTGRGSRAFPDRLRDFGSDPHGFAESAGDRCRLGGGSFFGTSASGPNLLTFVAGALTLLAFAAILRALWHWSGRAAAGSSEPPPSPQSGVARAVRRLLGARAGAGARGVCAHVGIGGHEQRPLPDWRMGGDRGTARASWRPAPAARTALLWASRCSACSTSGPSWPAG